MPPIPRGGTVGAVHGVAEAQAKLTAIHRRSPEMAQKAIRAGGAVLGEAMERRAPKLSGEMEDTIGKSIQMRHAGHLAEDIGTTHGLAAVFEFGGEITPTRAEFLRFEGRAGEVFTKRVVMPAKPFIRPAIDESRREMVRNVERSSRKSLRLIVQGQRP